MKIIGIAGLLMAMASPNIETNVTYGHYSVEMAETTDYGTKHIAKLLTRFDKNADDNLCHVIDRLEYEMKDTGKAIMFYSMEYFDDKCDGSVDYIHEVRITFPFGSSKVNELSGKAAGKNIQDEWDSAYKRGREKLNADGSIDKAEQKWIKEFKGKKNPRFDPL